MTYINGRPASLDFRLYSFWRNLPPGTGVTMEEMQDAMDVDDRQLIRMSLTKLRKGKVRDPSGGGRTLQPLPVRWNPRNRRYYDLSRLTTELVAAQVPDHIMSATFSQLMTRCLTIDSAMGADGFEESAHQLLDDDGIRALIEQLPLPTIWQVQAIVFRIGQARQLLELEERRRDRSLPPGDDA